MGMAAVVGGPLGQALLSQALTAGARGGSNALMILRFVRDDPMTRPLQANVARTFCLLPLSSRSHRIADKCRIQCVGVAAMTRPQRDCLTVCRPTLQASAKCDRRAKPGSMCRIAHTGRAGIEMMASAVVDTVGAAGAVLTTLCWVPQTVKIIRDRETRAISLPGTALCVIGVLLWLVYGIAITDGPLIGSSLVTFAMTGLILVLKIRHG